MKQKKITHEVLDVADFPRLETPKDSIAAIKEAFIECKNNPDAQISIMIGHFMAHYLGNKVYPSYLPLDEIPEQVVKQRILEKMKTFSLYTFRHGCEIIAALKADGYNVKGFILANDVTHIWDAYMDSANIKPDSTLDSNDKDADKIFTMEDLRQQLLEDFYSEQKLPDVYLQALRDNGLTLDDLISFDMPYLHITAGGKKKWKTKNIYCIRELTLQNNFDRFAKASLLLKDPFGYGRGNNEAALDIFMEGDPVLKKVKEEMLFCAQKDAPEMPGGLACSKEMMSLNAVLYGVQEGISEKIPEMYKPTKRFGLNVCINLIPMGCRNAVVGASSITARKLHPKTTSLRILNIPFASNAEFSDFQLLNGLQDR